jgi:hypothetical protein
VIRNAVLQNSKSTGFPEHLQSKAQHYLNRVLDKRYRGAGDELDFFSRHFKTHLVLIDVYAEGKHDIVRYGASFHAHSLSLTK